ncbi:MAG: HPF/RaiA family ribosome-associated protein [Candidatus Omnitrophota bacterium]|nr:HPF/RaiA family ribosome-associated protein [Candidatus Omnitrophota bacterium]
MKIDISFKYLESSPLIESVLDKDISKVQKRVQMFRKNQPVHLSVHMEKNPHREQYFCRSHIYLPSRVIKAEGRAEKLTVAINKNFSALTKQLDKVKYKLEKHLRAHRDKTQEPYELGR